MDVRKTNGSIEEFDKAKLARGIHQAYKSAKEYCDDAIVVSIINNLYVYEGITSAEIRRQLENPHPSESQKILSLQEFCATRWHHLLKTYCSPASGEEAPWEARTS